MAASPEEASSDQRAAIVIAVFVVALAAASPALAEGGPSSADPSVTAPSGPRAAPPEDPRRAFDVSADLGAGVLELFHGDVSLLTWGRLSRRFQFGAGVGGFPIDAALNALMGTEDVTVKAALLGITVKRSVQTKLITLRGFGRWYLFRKCFFGELSVEAWRLEAAVRGTATAEDYDGIIEVEATATVWIPMIGIHGGWRFLFDSGFFFEIAGGLNIFLSPGADLALGGTTIEQLREYEQARAVLEDAQGFLGGAVQDGANRIAKKVPVFPTGTLRLGWAFDVW